MSYFLVFCAFFSLTTAYADIEELEKIEVRAEKKASDDNFSAPYIIRQSNLETEASGLVAPLISESSGVISSQNGGPGGRVSYFIRGTESRHVSFTVDNLKINDPSNVDRQYDAAFMSSPWLEEVQIHKGPQAILYGSDALGGLIEMKTRKGGNAPQTRVDINAGSFGTVSTAIGNDWKTENHQGTVTGYQFRTDGISRLNQKRFKATERDSSEVAQVSSSSSHSWASKLNTDLLFSFSKGKAQQDSNTSDTSNDESRNDQYLAQQKTNFQISKASAISLRNGFNRHHRIIDTEFMGSNTETIYEGHIIQNEALYKYVDKSFSFLGGVSSEHELLQMSGLDKKFDLHSLFVQPSFRVSNFKIYAGSRLEKHVRYGTFQTGSAGFAYLFQDQKVFVQNSKGFKAPSLYQLYGPSFPGFPVGNTNLTPEMNHAWEAGWTLNKKNLDLGVTFFQNRLSNLITYTFNQGYFNQPRFIAEGIELSTKVKQKNFHIFSSFTHQSFRESEAAVVGRPANALQAGIAVFPNDSSEVSLKGKWFSSRQGADSNLNLVKLNGFESYDLGYRYLFEKVDLGVQIINLLNREYEELYGYSVMPRSVFFHSGFKF